MKTIAVVIPNWNGMAYLPRCLDSLDKQTSQDFELCVVDNGSSDGSLAFLSELSSRVKTVSLKENVGFAKAVNIGVHSTASPWILLLSNDTIAERHAIDTILRVIKESPSDVGMIACRMLRMEKPELIDNLGIHYRNDGYCQQRGNAERDSGEYITQRVFGPSGGAGVYSRNLLESVGGFDDDFFAYYEDVDVAFRSQLLGYDCLLAPGAIVYHIGNATMGTNSWFHVYHCSRNRILTLIKNLPARLLLKYSVHILQYQLWSLVTAFISGTFAAELRGKVAALGLLPTTLRKRKAILTRMTRTVEQIDTLLIHRSIFSRP